MTRSREGWNTLFRERKTEFSPEEFLIEHLSLLRGPRVLDLACGDGRNAFFLAEQGFEVTALDYSQVALKKIDKKGFSNITTVNADLSEPGALDSLGKYDSVLINHYLPSMEVLIFLKGLLANGGRIFMVAFDKDMGEVSDYSIVSDTIDKTFSGEEVVVNKSFKNEWGSFKGIILEKI